MPVYSNGDRTVEVVQFVGQVIPGLSRDVEGFFLASGKRTQRVEMGDYVVLRDGQPRSVEPRGEFLSEYRRVDPVR